MHNQIAWGHSNSGYAERMVNQLGLNKLHHVGFYDGTKRRLKEHLARAQCTMWEKRKGMERERKKVWFGWNSPHEGKRGGLRWGAV